MCVSRLAVCGFVVVCLLSQRERLVGVREEENMHKKTVYAKHDGQFSIC